MQFTECPHRCGHGVNPAHIKPPISYWQLAAAITLNSLSKCNQWRQCMGRGSRRPLPPTLLNKEHRGYDPLLYFLGFGFIIILCTAIKRCIHKAFCSGVPSACCDYVLLSLVDKESCSGLWQSRIESDGKSKQRYRRRMESGRCQETGNATARRQYLD